VTTVIAGTSLFNTMDHARRQALRSAYAYGTSTSWLFLLARHAQMRATATDGGSEKQPSGVHNAIIIVNVK
jgi:hypothetical protein